MKNLPDLIGEKLWLGSFNHTPEFYQTYQSWISDPKIQSRIYIPRIYTLEEIAQNIKEDEDDPNIERWCVYEGKHPARDTPLGEISLISLDQEAEFKEDDKEYINFLKPKEIDEIILTKKQRNGYGTEVIKLILNHVFKESQAVYLQVYPDNTPAIKLYNKFGFKELTKKTSKLSGKEVSVMRITLNDLKKI